MTGGWRELGRPVAVYNVSEDHQSERKVRAGEAGCLKVMRDE